MNGNRNARIADGRSKRVGTGAPRQLRAAGAGKVFREVVSGTSTERPAVRPRTGGAEPAADCVRLGLSFSVHTAAPCSNIGTLQLVHAAVTRKCSVDGSVVGPEQGCHCRTRYAR